MQNLCLGFYAKFYKTALPKKGRGIFGGRPRLKIKKGGKGPSSPLSPFFVSV